MRACQMFSFLCSDYWSIFLSPLSIFPLSLLNFSSFILRVLQSPGVKAYAACCIADILRYYAPNAPYDPPRLKVPSPSHHLLTVVFPGAPI